VFFFVFSCRLAVDAVELDPVVVQLARQHFGLPEGPRLQVGVSC
jgi:spermidine synthase